MGMIISCFTTNSRGFAFLPFRKQKSPIRRNLQEKWKNLATLPTNLKLDAILNQKVTSVDRVFADDLFDIFTRISSCIRKNNNSMAMLMVGVTIGNSYKKWSIFRVDLYRSKTKKCKFLCQIFRFFLFNPNYWLSGAFKVRRWFSCNDFICS